MHTINFAVLDDEWNDKTPYHSMIILGRINPFGISREGVTLCYKQEPLKQLNVASPRMPGSDNTNRHTMTGLRHKV